jgi:hypothetical protein
MKLVNVSVGEKENSNATHLRAERGARRETSRNGKGRDERIFQWNMLEVLRSLKR